MCVAWTRLADIDVTESEERGGNRAVPLSLSFSLSPCRWPRARRIKCVELWVVETGKSEEKKLQSSPRAQGAGLKRYT